MGIMAGAPLAPNLLISTVPSDPMTSELAAKKERVYMMFSAMDCCAHPGTALISMLEPQAAAMLLFAVCMLVYEPMADMSELCVYGQIGSKIEPELYDLR